jgi:hypothetical protein
MAEINKTLLKGADGTVLGDIDPPPSVIREFISQWIDWIYNLYEYVGIVNENFLTVEDWTAVSFTNSWANKSGDAAAAYYLDPFGRVWLKGGIDTGTNSTSAFTLPTGYRPSERQIFTTSKIASSGTSGIVIVNTDGTVVPTIGNTNGVSLAGMSFRI